MYRFFSFWVAGGAGVFANIQPDSRAVVSKNGREPLLRVHRENDQDVR